MAIHCQIPIFFEQIKCVYAVQCNKKVQTKKRFQQLMEAEAFKIL
jgi:hypothetical protein